MLGKAETYETLAIAPLVRAVALAAGRREQYVDITNYHSDDTAVRLHRMADILEQLEAGYIQLTRVV